MAATGAVRWPWFPGDDTLKHVGEPRHRIYAVEFGRLDQRHGNGPMTCSAVGTCE